MHPQTFLRTFWRLELKPQVFVAMTFAPQYDVRFKNVVAPAIQSLAVDGKPLVPHRVDTSKSGDSILTDISDGIAHCRLFLADVSSVGRDAITGQSYRNGNVMYEVGLALACRHPSEVLLIRDDRDKFLFDVSTIPHVTLDFTDTRTATTILGEHLQARLREQSFVRDARVQLAMTSLSAEEIILLKQMRNYAQNAVWGRKVKGLATWYALGTSRLLDKGLIKLAGEFPDDMPAFAFTPLGYVVSQRVNAGLRQFQAASPSSGGAAENQEAAQPSAPADSP